MTRPPALASRPARNERGVVFPSPVVILSVLAVAMAGIAFVATRDTAPQEKQISTIAQPEPSATPTAAHGQAGQAPEAEDRPLEVYVVVFNNSNVTGLAGRVAAKATQIGWQVETTTSGTGWRGLRAGHVAPHAAVHVGLRRARHAQRAAL